MNEWDVKIANLRAIVAGQEQTINEQEAEITRLRKREVELSEQLDDAVEDLRDTLQQIQEMINRYNGKEDPPWKG